MTDLEIDREVESIRALLREASSPGAPDDIADRTELRKRIDEQVASMVERFGDEVVAFGIGRALAYDAGEQDRLRKAKAAIVSQYDDQIAALQTPVSLFELLMDDLARRHREKTKRATMKVPGVGTWSTRVERVNDDGTPAVVARVTDAEAAIAWLADREDRDQFVQDVPKLKTNEFKAHALAWFESEGEVLAGVTVETAEITVSHRLAAE